MLFVLFLLAALAITAREIVKDIEDIEGDKVEGADTLPIRVGAKKAGYLAVFIGLLAVLLSPLPYFSLCVFALISHLPPPSRSSLLRVPLPPFAPLR